jgi:hypothetical protein
VEYKVLGYKGSRPLHGASTLSTWAGVVKEARPELGWTFGRQIGGVVSWCRENLLPIYVRQSRGMPWRRIDDNFG